MSENPYAPPSSRVVDPKTPEPRSLPPVVLAAVVLLCIGSAMDLLGFITLIPAMNRGEMSPLYLVFGSIVIAFTLVCIWNVVRGKNWARIGLLLAGLLLVGTTISSFVEFHAYLRLTINTLTSMVARPALSVIALILLFGPGRHWFAAR